MTKSGLAAFAAALAVAVAGTPAVSASLVKQFTIAPGKGISFFMGGQQGSAIFTQDAGACGLTLTISQVPAAEGMSGMSGGMSGSAAKGSSIKMVVMPARPAHLHTADGQQLVFNCGPDATQMFLEMPTEFKYSEK